MRSFIAVELSEGIRERLSEIQGEFRDIQRSVKFVNAAQAHITLKFLGEVAEENVGKIKEVLEGINYGKFDIELKGVGFFPKASLEKAKKIRVIWVGVEKGKEEFKGLQEEVDFKMKGLGFPAEKKFNAHATICRVKKASKNDIEKALKKIAMLKDAYVGRMVVEEIKLKKSTLTRKGPIYEDVYVKRLKN